MKKHSKATFFQVAFTHFVPCFFLGVISLFFLQNAFPYDIFRSLVDNRIGLLDLALATANGIFVAGCVAGFHLNHNRRVRKGLAWINPPASKEKIRLGTLVGFISGSFDILFGLHNFGIFVLTIFVLAILAWHLKIFTRRVVDMLEPGSISTWQEVTELLRIFLNMLAGFTLVNATLEAAHLLAGALPPFGFGSNHGQIFIDALYYTVVTMTTLGFGDIVPKSWDGKLLLIFQSLISYVMFALMVGIITRGVVRERQDSQSSANTDPHE